MCPLQEIYRTCKNGMSPINHVPQEDRKFHFLSSAKGESLVSDIGLIQSPKGESLVSDIGLIQSPKGESLVSDIGLIQSPKGDPVVSNNYRINPEPKRRTARKQ